MRDTIPPDQILPSPPPSPPARAAPTPPSRFVSPPPSPSHAGSRSHRSWHEPEDVLNSSPPPPSAEWAGAQKRRSKGKHRAAMPSEDDGADLGDGAPLRPLSFQDPRDTPPSSPRHSADDGGAYPPTTEAASETRRVEEVSLGCCCYCSTPS
jgi:hypothetical protein